MEFRGFRGFRGFGVLGFWGFIGFRVLGFRGFGAFGAWHPELGVVTYTIFPRFPNRKLILYLIRLPSFYPYKS